jgi:hypothetical protein
MLVNLPIEIKIPTFVYFFVCKLKYFVMCVFVCCDCLCIFLRFKS